MMSLRPEISGFDLRDGSFIDFAVDAPDRLGDVEEATRGDLTDILESALLQRPIFGKEQDSEWTAYGYLTNEELGRLLAHRAALPRLGEDEHGFAADFFGWLEEIHRAELDYRFHSA